MISFDKNYDFLNNANFQSEENKEFIFETLTKIKSLFKQNEFIDCTKEIYSLVDFLIRNEQTKTKWHDINTSEEKKLKEIIDNINRDYNLDNEEYNLLSSFRNSLYFDLNRDNIKNFEVLSHIKTIWSYLKKCYAPNANIEFNDGLYVENSASITNPNVSIVNKNNDNNHINVEKISIEDWLSINKLKGKEHLKIFIPMYQREYTWSNKNIDQLLDDIEKRQQDNGEHYFGTMAVKKDSNDIKIIDGQQRLTTSLILVCAARDYLIHTVGININEIAIDLMKNNHFTTLYKNVTFNDTQTKCLNIIIDDKKRNLGEIFNNKMMKSQFYINYRHIINYFSNKHMSKLNVQDFVNVFIKKFSTSTILFDKETYDNKKEIEIFENLNSKGKGLTSYDLTKQFIFNTCNNEMFKSETQSQQIHDRYINTIEENLKLFSKNNNHKNYLDFFKTLVNYSEIVQISKEENELFKLICNALIKVNGNSTYNFSSIDEYQLFLDKINAYLEIFVNLNDDKRFHQFLIKYKIDEIVFIINQKDKRYLLASYLYLIKDYLAKNQIKDSDLTTEQIGAFQAIILSVVKFIIRTTTISIQGDNQIRQLVIRGMIRMKEELIKSNWTTPLEDLVQSLKEFFEINSKNNYNNVLLESSLLSNKLIDTEGFAPVFNLFVYSLNLDWYDKKQKLFPIISDKNASWLNDEELIKIKQIGNYILLDENKIKMLEKESFEYAKNHFNTPIALTYKNNEFNTGVEQHNEWNLETIQERSKKIVNYLINNVFNKY